MHVALSIAGLDPEGASGLLRDVRTFEKLNVHALGVVTALTFQRLSNVIGYQVLSPESVRKQIESILEDFSVKYVKVGMIGNGEIAKIIAEYARELDWFLVVDPVFRSSSGQMLVDSPKSYEILLREAGVITPNVEEAEILLGERIRTREDVIRAGWKLRDLYGCVIIKGGHLEGEDFLFCDSDLSIKMNLLPRNPRGTGCAYSSALTAYLSRGYGIEEAFKKTKLFIQREIERSERGGDVFLLP